MGDIPWWLRVGTWAWRFQTLKIAERVRGQLPRPCWKERTLFGGRFAVDVSSSATHLLLYLQGERTIEERFLVTSLLRPGMTVVDVGANIGYYLLMFERSIGPQGFVVAVEPSPENLPHLKKTIALNGFGNVELQPVALGSVAGSVGFRSGINGGVTEQESGVYEVPVMPLDTLVQRRVDLLKIDVEGFEGQVLEGARQVIERDRPILFLEVHPQMIGRFGRTLGDIFEYLRAWYGVIDLYETTPLSKQSLVTKLANRYLSGSALRRIDNLDDYLDRCAGFPVGHTFWAICRPGSDSR